MRRRVLDHSGPVPPLRSSSLSVLVPPRRRDSIAHRIDHHDDDDDEYDGFVQDPLATERAYRAENGSGSILEDRSSNLNSGAAVDQYAGGRQGRPRRRKRHKRSRGVISFIAEKITTADYWGFIPSTQVFEDVEVFVDSIQRQLVIELRDDDDKEEEKEEEEDYGYRRSQYTRDKWAKAASPARNPGGSDSNDSASEGGGDDRAKLSENGNIVQNVSDTGEGEVKRPGDLVKRVAHKLRDTITAKVKRGKSRRNLSFFDTYRSDDDDESESEDEIIADDDVDNDDFSIAKAVGVEDSEIAVRLRSKLRVDISARSTTPPRTVAKNGYVNTTESGCSRERGGSSPLSNGEVSPRQRHLFISSSNELSRLDKGKSKPRRLVLKWDNITGLDFQYAPCAPVTVVIEVNKIPDNCPKGLESVVYFLSCTKEQVGMFLDDQMIAQDKRLFQIAMKSLPTWSIIVNRYSLPVYYSHRFRIFITTLVNIYIVISLIWGFYDLYKNLPFIGSALRSVFDPVIRLLTPIMNNTVVLLIPLVWNQAIGVFRKVFGLATSCFGDIPIFNLLSSVHAFVAQYFWQLVRIVQPLLDFIVAIKNFVVVVVSFWGSVIWSLLQLPIAIVRIFGSSLITLFQELRFIVVTLFSGGMSIIMAVYNVVYGLVYAVYTVFSILFQVVVYPLQKLRALFALGSRIDIQQAQETIHAVQKVGSATAASSEGIRGIIRRIQETLTPFQRVWSGFRRIVDSIIHTYHTKIKYRSKYKQRILITVLILAVLAATVVVFLLIM